MNLKPLAIALLAGAAAANPADDILTRLRESERKLALARMLAASGERCGDVLEAFRQGRDRHDNAYWSVRCSTGTALQVRIAPDSHGSTRITPCAAIAAVKGTVPCFVRFSPH